jgi:hypothetical protein
MGKNFILLTLVCLLGISMPATAQIDERFTGNWALEAVEVHESPFDKPQQVKKISYSLSNLSELAFFTVVTKINLENEREAVNADDVNVITTAAGEYRNPVVRFFNENSLKFSDEERIDEIDHNQFQYIFITPEKVLLVSHEIFYPKNGTTVRAELHLTLSRVSK